MVVGVGCLVGKVVGGCVVVQAGGLCGCVVVQVVWLCGRVVVGGCVVVWLWRWVSGSVGGAGVRPGEEVMGRCWFVGLGRSAGKVCWFGGLGRAAGRFGSLGG